MSYQSNRKSGKGNFMKTRMMVLCCLMGAIVLSMGHEYSQAQPKLSAGSSKIGVVNIMKVFRSCKRSTAHRTEIITEQGIIRARLEKLSKLLEAEEAGLRALKPESDDYLAQRKELIIKRADLNAQQTYNKEELILKEYKWSKKLYQDILRITEEVAKQKMLDLVLEKQEIDAISLSLNEINQTIQTHKVLYSAGCVDISDEVVARLDRE